MQPTRGYPSCDHRTVTPLHAGVICRAMARRSLRPQLNQIRTWVRQGRTDAWIAHQLEATVQQISAFKAENDLTEGEAEGTETVAVVGDVDLRAEDDALIAKELEAEAAKRAEEQAKAEAEAKAAAAAKAAAGDTDDDSDDDDEAAPAGAVADVAEVADAAAPRRRSKRRSTTAKRDTGSGSTPPWPTAPSTQSTGRVTARSKCSSKRIRSSSAAPASRASRPTHRPPATRPSSPRRTHNTKARYAGPSAHGAPLYAAALPLALSAARPHPCRRHGAGRAGSRLPRSSTVHQAWLKNTDLSNGAAPSSASSARTRSAAASCSLSPTCCSPSSAAASDSPSCCAN